MIQIGKSYQDGNGDWVTIDGYINTSLKYFFSSDHDYYNKRGEFLIWKDKNKTQLTASPNHKMNLYI